MKTAESAHRAADKRRSAVDALLDHALEETFPASDPTAIAIEAPTVSRDEPRRGAKTKP